MFSKAVTLATAVSVGREVKNYYPDLSPCGFYMGPKKLLPTWREPQSKGPRLSDVSEVRSKVQQLIHWCDKHNDGNLVVRHVDTKCNNIDRQKEMRAILQSVKRIASGSDAAKYADSIALMDQRFSRAWRFSSRGT
jgi:DNA topoisomerase IA